ncbi:MAG: Txe/YoeB family addiction module toxin [Clostridiales bacterium]|nr:Txe/YoeB family addiction module toxin [Clostridiales bacterium]
MAQYSLKFSRQSYKDYENLAGANLDDKIDDILTILKSNPFKWAPNFEKLRGKLKGVYSRRINNKHRIWYFVNKSKKTVYIIRMWSHYE